MNVELSSRISYGEPGAGIAEWRLCYQLRRSMNTAAQCLACSSIASQSLVAMNLVRYLAHRQVVAYSRHCLPRSLKIIENPSLPISAIQHSPHSRSTHFCVLLVSLAAFYSLQCSPLGLANHWPLGLLCTIKTAEKLK